MRPQVMGDAYPLWIRIPFAVFVAVLIPVYWHAYGPDNFLWFSDIALFAVLVGLWTGNRLLHSMIAIGVLPLEVLWTVDFLAAGALLGIAAYMFDSTIALVLRALSLFHLFLPPIIIWMLIRQGYDRRALLVQTVLVWVVLPATWLLTDPQENINWVHGVGKPPQPVLPPVLYLAAYMTLLPLLVLLPMHLLLNHLFGGARPLEHR